MLAEPPNDPERLRSCVAAIADRLSQAKSPLAARITAVIFLASGFFAISFAIQRFTQGGY
jgi:hypothetical protein